MKRKFKYRWALTTYTSDGIVGITVYPSEEEAVERGAKLAVSWRNNNRNVDKDLAKELVQLYRNREFQEVLDAWEQAQYEGGDHMDEINVMSVKVYS